MPIKFKCSCGHVLSVPEKFAGKQGKCPKCQKKLQVPSPSSGSAGGGASQAGAKSPSKPTAKVGSAAAASQSGSKSHSKTRSGGASRGGGRQPAAPSQLDSLFEEAGLVRKTGPVCPECSASIKKGTIVCTHCGFNLQTGERVAGYEGVYAKEEFDNLHLQEAARRMTSDQDMDTRREKAAMPWWVLMSFLIGAIMLGAAGVIIIDGQFGEPEPEGTFLGKLQRLPVFVVLGTTIGVTGLAITVFAHLSIVLFAFSKSGKQGAACFFLPFLYSVVYGIMHWTENKAPTKAIIMALVLIGFAVFLIIQGGGFGHLSDLF